MTNTNKYTAQDQLNSTYGKKPIGELVPVMTTGIFQCGYGAKAGDVIRWEWNSTFQRWEALVRFTEGKRAGEEWFSYPV